MNTQSINEDDDRISEDGDLYGDEEDAYVDDTYHDQRLPPVRGGTPQRKIFHLVNWTQLIHPGLSSSRSSFCMESSQSCAATLTHYSIEPLTTGPDYDPLLLLFSRQGTPASRTSLAKVQATCVKYARIGYIQDLLVFETLPIIIEPMAGSVPPV